MDQGNSSRLLRPAAYCAMSAAFILILMLLVTIISGGVSQQTFETISDAASYMALMQLGEQPLRLIIGLDNLFILAYTAALVMGVYGLKRGGEEALAIAVSVGVISLALFDLVENTDFLRMMGIMNAGGEISLEEIGWRMHASLVKWQIGYLALFIYAFLIPGTSLPGWLLKLSLWFVLPLIGALLVILPNEYHYLALLARYAAMLTGFILFAIVFLKDSAKDNQS